MKWQHSLKLQNSLKSQNSRKCKKSHRNHKIDEKNQCTKITKITKLTTKKKSLKSQNYLLWQMQIASVIRIQAIGEIPAFFIRFRTFNWNPNGTLIKGNLGLQILRFNHPGIFIGIDNLRGHINSPQTLDFVNVSKRFIT